MLRAFLVLVVMAMAGSPALADDVVLTVMRPNGEPQTYAMEALEALGVKTITTTTSWTDGPVRFEGVPVAAILDAAGGAPTTVKAIAINDYSADLPADELRRYPAIVATRMNGERMALRDKGPLWIVYPRDDFPELNDEKHNFKWVWQLKALELR